ncbi:thioesterase II family protein, partial [Streptomyces sp. NPDC001880]
MNDPWLTVPGEQPQGAATGTLAVCFAPTGAHGSTFASWRGLIPEDTTLAFVAPPGRGTRVDEEPVTDMAAYADAVAAGIRELLVPRQTTFAPSRRPARTLAAPDESPSTAGTRASGRHVESTHRTPLLDGPTLPAAVLGGRRLVLIGVSLGALLAYETCRRLLDAGVPVARLCAVAGQCPGDFYGRGEDVTVEDARAFVAGTGLTDPELLADPEFEEVLLPPVIADLRLAAGYDGRRGPVPQVELRAVWATDDPHVPEVTVRRWAEWTRGECTLLSVEGGHYAHQANPAAVISACLDGLTGTRPSRRSVLGAGATAVASTVLGLGAVASAAPAA